MKNVIQQFSQRLQQQRMLQCIRSGLVMAIPVLMVGCIGLVLRSLSIQPYQEFINSFYNGIIYEFFSFIYNATFGLLGLYISVFISISYSNVFIKSNKFELGPTISSVIAFAIFSGFGSQKFNTENFGVKGMFTAIVCGLLASAIYNFLHSKMSSENELFSEGADGEFLNAVSMIFPVAITSVIFALINVLVILTTGHDFTYDLFISAANGVFLGMGRTLGSTIMFVLTSSVLWFFGIHGSDILQGVSEKIFQPAVEINAQRVALGLEPNQIFSKTFIDVFVLMGGCGTAMCLLIAILAFSKSRPNRSLGKMTIFPMIFNVNEMMVFGLPIVFNPILFIPFLITPIIMTLTTFGAMSIGLVPIACNSVEWTTPILFSGYMATGSIAGSILQLVNLVIGVAIYAPFIKFYDKQREDFSYIKLQKLVDTIKECEIYGKDISVLSLPDSRGAVARELSYDLKSYLRKNYPVVYYQPQFDNKGKCVSAEALLRYSHQLYGMLYPPLVLKIAQESNMLMELEKSVFRRVASDMPRLKASLGENIKICVNASGTAIQSVEFEEFLVSLKDEFDVSPQNFCIEITERTTVKFDEKITDRCNLLKKCGYSFAIDDFSMGSTSLKYLQKNLFSLVKLDGSLVKDMMDNIRSEKIIASLLSLSKDLDFNVLAEFVETQEQKEKLEKLGCNYYQGWLYSPAVSLEELEQKRI